MTTFITIQQAISNMNMLTAFFGRNALINMYSNVLSKYNIYNNAYYTSSGRAIVNCKPLGINNQHNMKVKRQGQPIQRGGGNRCPL